MKTILFHRRVHAFQGGHLKVWDYFNHTRALPGYSARAHITNDSVWDERNPWTRLAGRALLEEQWQPERADGLFLGGKDWLALDPAWRRRPAKPILNLIQSVRHADPEQPLYAFLEHRAVRVCVSPAVEDVLLQTGRVNGPLFTIANAIELAELPAPRPWDEKPIDLLIVALKAPALGVKLAAELNQAKRSVKLLTGPLPRPQFLDRLNNARVILFLPQATEGFYLPALEGMALGALVVCPDCVGNRAFCRADWNCLRPTYERHDLCAAAWRALRMQEADIRTLRTNAVQTVTGHTLDRERREFQEILANVSQLW